MGIAPGEVEQLYEVLFTEKKIARRIAELAKEITRDYSGRCPLIVGVLTGAAHFASDLVRKLPIDVEMDFVAIESYGAATRSSGEVKLLKDLNTPVQGRDVLIIEDIIDTGLTLQFLLNHFWARHPASVATCVLLDKPSRRKAQVPVDYTGFVIEDRFVVGYGLDCAGQYRQLPYVAVLKEDGNQPAGDFVRAIGGSRGASHSK